jgi:DNA-binding response OmpR family regulator
MMTIEKPSDLQASATIVIADDEPSMRLLLHTAIESDDYQVVEAADGDEAWTLIKQYRPALVLLDVQMPGLSGLEILALIRSDPSINMTRVIVLTAKALEADIAAGLTAGADTYLTKPFSPIDLLKRVDDAMRRWRSTQPAPVTSANPAGHANGSVGSRPDTKSRAAS